MLKTIDMSTTHVDLEKLLAEVEEGAEILLVKGTTPIAHVTPAQKKPRIAGLHENQGGWISDDFDAPLPDEFWLGDE